MVRYSVRALCTRSPGAGAGLLVINPPYGLAEQMRQVARVIAPRLDADIRTNWIAGSE